MSNKEKIAKMVIRFTVEEIDESGKLIHLTEKEFELPLITGGGDETDERFLEVMRKSVLDSTAIFDVGKQVMESSKKL